VSGPTTTVGPLFLTFEGIEGTGKSTQVARLAHWLRARGLDPVVTREPGGTELGRKLRAALLAPTDEPFAPEAELLLYVADRAQHLACVVEPGLADGRIVLCDRYVDATVAYQGYARGLGPDHVRALHREPPLSRLPDRTLLFDLAPATGLGRARARNLAERTDASEGRFEQELLAFHERVRDGYRAIASAEPQRVRTIDAEGSIEAVEQRVHAALADLLGRLSSPDEE